MEFHLWKIGQLWIIKKNLSFKMRIKLIVPCFWFNNREICRMRASCQEVWMPSIAKQVTIWIKTRFNLKVLHRKIPSCKMCTKDTMFSKLIKKRKKSKEFPRKIKKNFNLALALCNLKISKFPPLQRTRETLRVFQFRQPAVFKWNPHQTLPIR